MRITEAPCLWIARANVRVQGPFYSLFLTFFFLKREFWTGRAYIDTFERRKTIKTTTITNCARERLHRTTTTRQSSAEAAADKKKGGGGGAYKLYIYIYIYNTILLCYIAASEIRLGFLRQQLYRGTRLAQRLFIYFRQHWSEMEI